MTIAKTNIFVDITSASRLSVVVLCGSLDDGGSFHAPLLPGHLEASVQTGAQGLGFRMI